MLQLVLGQKRVSRPPPHGSPRRRTSSVLSIISVASTAFLRPRTIALVSALPSAIREPAHEPCSCQDLPCSLARCQRGLVLIACLALRSDAEHRACACVVRHGRNSNCPLTTTQQSFVRSFVMFTDAAPGCAAAATVSTAWQLEGQRPFSPPQQPQESVGSLGCR